MGSYTRMIEVTIEVEVEFDYVPGTDAVMYLPNGDPGYPAEPEEFLISEIRLGIDDEVIDIGDSLNASEMDQIEQALNDMGMDDY